MRGNITTRFAPSSRPRPKRWPSSAGRRAPAGRQPRGARARVEPGLRCRSRAPARCRRPSFASSIGAGRPACSPWRSGRSTPDVSSPFATSPSNGTLEDALSHYRRVESLGYLTASVIHDFNNLLSPIVSASELLADELPRGSRARKMMASEIRMAAERAAGLVRELMRLARRQPATPQRVNVNDAIDELRPLIARGLP